jgi:hypothetical protein
MCAFTMLRSSIVIFSLAALACAGCVRRTITITSDPEGALCRLNGREVGRTPVEVDFVYYGEYDVVLEKDGYEPLLTSGAAIPPWWENIPLDLAAEAMPGEPRADIRWHYQLQPRDDDPVGLVERARGLRERVETEFPPPATQPQREETPPATQAGGDSSR